MPDKYSSYRQLQKNHKENVDYSISESATESRICVFSPHGGGIEPGVSELVRAIASEDFSWYLFEGKLKAQNWDLHITSHRFNEPRAIAFIRRHPIALAIHGKNVETSTRTYLGGRNVQARELVGKALRSSGFDVPETTPSNMLGEEKSNICNRCGDLQGVQLEVTRGQRIQFFEEGLVNRADVKGRTQKFSRYVFAVRLALHQLENEFESFRTNIGG